MVTLGTHRDSKMVKHRVTKIRPAISCRRKKLSDYIVRQQQSASKLQQNTVVYEQITFIEIVIIVMNMPERVQTTV